MSSNCSRAKRYSKEEAKKEVHLTDNKIDNWRGEERIMREVIDRLCEEFVECDGDGNRDYNEFHKEKLKWRIY
jgi:hypothetical protein